MSPTIADHTSRSNCRPFIKEQVHLVVITRTKVVSAACLYMCGLPDLSELIGALSNIHIS